MKQKKKPQSKKTDRPDELGVAIPSTKKNLTLDNHSTVVNANPILDIPQHKLINNEGKFVDFDISIFGKKEQGYDFEKPHRHAFYEVVFFMEGEGTHDIDFKTYKVHSCSVHFVASDNVHLVLRSKKSSGYSLLFTANYFNQDLINQLPFSKTTPFVQLDQKAFALINSLVNNIKAEYLTKEPGYENIIKTYAEAVMLNLLRLCNKQHPSEEIKNAKPPLISSFMQLVQQQHVNQYNVEQYAEKLNISSKHLIELCKIHIGQTPLVYIREYSISEAKRLLFHTQLSIKEIAYKLNFNDPTNFSKYFKAATGYSPVEYREGIR